jgi:signal transduction histidine kinase
MLCVIIAFSWISNISVKKASREISTERLNTLTEQLSSMLAQSAQTLVVSTGAAAKQEVIKNYFLPENNSQDTVVLQSLEKLRPDSTWPLTLLTNAKREIVLQSGLKDVHIPIGLDSVIRQLSLAPDSTKIGKLYQSGDTIYYPIVATVTNRTKITGYLIRWRVQKSTAKAVAQFSQLLGDNATLYIGNADGSLWTDLNKIVPGPPANTQSKNHFLEYTRPGADEVLAKARPLANTQWIMLIEFSQARILDTTNRFFYWLLILGSILVTLGIFIAWLISRNITKPLNKLTDAASVIAKGDYSVSVETDREDELGQLAHAFNSMAVQVNNANANLERKVKERTVQFEEANKELESFSYSVSHDLRAPLRIINTYTEFLKSDYKDNLDAEGRKMLDAIGTNAKKMDRLIDDLLNLSRLGRKELVVNNVDMTGLVESVIKEKELFETNQTVIKIGELHPARCDRSLISQVWINLISNAIKYSGKKETPVIEISSQKTSHEIIYRIKDNGVGFDMKYAGKLFGVFQRLHKATDYEGTGVGLALINRIVLRHRGRVWADAAVDKGATFYFALPL